MGRSDSLLGPAFLLHIQFADPPGLFWQKQRVITILIFPLLPRRVCVVNSAGNVLLDEHVAQRERVTDYRTRFSGIRPSDLVGAPSLEDVQRRVADMLKGRTVVGHAITNDLTVSSCESASIASAKIRRFGLPKNG